MTSVRMPAPPSMEPPRGDGKNPGRGAGASFWRSRAWLLACGGLLARASLAAVLLLLPYPAVAAEPAVATFTPSDADPYFRTGPAADAAAKLRREEFSEA